MKKQVLAGLAVVILLLQIVYISALSASEARQNWLDAKQASLEAQQKYRNAKADYLLDKSAENDQAVIETGKGALNAALDEAEAWLIWKKAEAQENPEISNDLRNAIINDVETNLNKIDELRLQVDGIDSQLELGTVFLSMIGKYFELLTDVARDTGKSWIEFADKKVSTMEDYESKLRSAATDNSEALAKLDEAKNYIEQAKTNINNAENSYNQVVLPGTPFIKFAEGNNHLRAARLNLINAAQDLKQAYLLLA